MACTEGSWNHRDHCDLETLSESHKKPEEEGVGILRPIPYLTAEAQKGEDSGRGGTQQIVHS